MSINKGNATRFVKESVPYDIISREIAQSVNNPVALAIWVYLQTKPDNWTPRRAEIMSHFDGLGRDRYDQALRELKGLGLVWVADTRDEKGRIIDRVMVCESLPKVGKPATRVNQQDGKATLGESRPLKETETVKETETSKETEIKRITSDAFNEFWEAYPKKVDKKKSQAKFMKLKPAIQKLAVENVKARAKSDQQWTEGFAPNPTTYLNGERWDDEWAKKDSVPAWRKEQGYYE